MRGGREREDKTAECAGLAIVSISRGFWERQLEFGGI